MSRSSQRDVARLLREGRGVLGVRTNAEVWAAVARVQEQVKGMVKEATGDAVTFSQISCYKDGCWTVNFMKGVDGGLSYNTLYPGIETILKDPERIAGMVVDFARQRGWVAEPEPEAPAPGM